MIGSLRCGDDATRRRNLAPDRYGLTTTPPVIGSGTPVVAG